VDKERRNPIFLKFNDMDLFENALSQAVKDCSDSTVPTRTTRARRLTKRLMQIVGFEEWLRLFPNSKAEWTFDD
jgi:hypothetical protein